ncbi:MAG: chemotaxis protein CheA [Spirochaetales bacterium]|nr:chemotaxis protein CheA [Spirochaetales bacterium]
MSDYLDPNNDELLKDFFVEAQLQVETLEQNILVLENDPANKDAIDEIFRAAHTLKGAAATVQMNELAGFTHLVEDVLDEIRSGTVAVTEPMIDVLLTSIDVTKAMLNERLGGSVYREDISAVTDQLTSFLPGSKAKKVATSAREKAAPVRSGASKAGAKKSGSKRSGLSEYDVLELVQAAGNQNVFEIAVYFNEDHPMNTVGGIQVFAALKETGTVLRTEPEFDELYTDTFYPVVHYYLASDKDPESLLRITSIPDVVIETDVINLREGTVAVEDESGGKGKKKAEPQKTGKAAESRAEAAREEKRDDGSIADEIEEEQAKARRAEPKKPQMAGSVLRVDSKRIDNLLNLVSEAVITKATFNQISTQFADTQIVLKNTEATFREKLKDLFDSLPNYLERIQNGSTIKSVRKEIIDNFGDMFNLITPLESQLKQSISKFRSTSQNLARTISDLQEGVMQIRMVPISQIFSRFPRLVRDVSKSLNKKVMLHIEGEDTELDKSVIEDLLDPLIHCVRNSIDHGIEAPGDRVKAGKEEEGEILLKASNEGNMIIIEVSDNGAGIDVNSIHAKAIERGLIHPNKQLSNIEAFNLIFEPGFSTAKKVTDISGRGVGLDVVKKQIEKLNGSVSVWSEKGTGTRLTIKLPLTLAIIQGLLIRVGKEIYAIPITSVIDSHRIRLSEIRMIDNYEVFNVREDVISVLRLSRLFKIATEETSEYHFLVIVGSGDKKVGLIVDSLIGEEDVVIKPLKDKYTNSPGIAGATILGDGTVSLIIDVSQLLDLGLAKEKERRQRREAVIQ